jgi:hypothetical protein
MGGSTSTTIFQKTGTKPKTQNPYPDDQKKYVNLVQAQHETPSKHGENSIMVHT